VQPDGESRLKKAAIGAGGYAIGLIVVVLGLFLLALLLRGMVWASDKLMPWLVKASGIALLICIFIFLPMSLFRRLRALAGMGCYYASYVFGSMLFAYSCLYVVFAWGYMALAIGLIFAGVGVVPVAFLAAIFHGEWLAFWELVFGIVLTFGTRGFALWLITKAERDAQAEYALANEDSVSWQ
jgi:hypothetical protein